MTRDIGRLRDHTILCGYGRMGRILAGHLARRDQPLVVIDREREKVLEAAHRRAARLAEPVDLSMPPPRLSGHAGPHTSHT